MTIKSELPRSDLTAAYGRRFGGADVANCDDGSSAGGSATGAAFSSPSNVPAWMNTAGVPGLGQQQSFLPQSGAAFAMQRQLAMLAAAAQNPYAAAAVAQQQQQQQQNLMMAAAGVDPSMVSALFAQGLAMGRQAMGTDFGALQFMSDESSMNMMMQRMMMMQQQAAMASMMQGGMMAAGLLGGLPGSSATLPGQAALMELLTRASTAKQQRKYMAFLQTLKQDDDDESEDEDIAKANLMSGIPSFLKLPTNTINNGGSDLGDMKIEQQAIQLPCHEVREEEETLNKDDVSSDMSASRPTKKAKLSSSTPLTSTQLPQEQPLSAKHNSIPFFGPVSEEAPLKRKAGRPKNFDKTRPKRPLSAYNLFFKEEREKLLNEQLATGGSGAIKTKRKNLKRKKSGAKEGNDEDEVIVQQISFQTLAKIIGARWKEIDQEQMQLYKKKAEDEMKEYKNKMNIWYKRKAGVAATEGSTCNTN